MSNLDESPDNIVDKLENFENKHKAFINLFIKPFGTLLIFLALGYYTMWMSSNYVKQEKFNLFVEKQEKLIESNFEITRTQLQTILNQQTTFTEQLKAYNMQIINLQKASDALSERVTYIERNLYKRENIFNE
jgi:hypothetical protein